MPSPAAAAHHAHGRADPGAGGVIPERLPWHGPQWQRIGRSIRSGRMPHALLLRGVVGNGKALFAARLAAVLSCRSGDPPCGECDSCRLCAAGNHPDRVDVGLEPERREIVVDQIRGLIHSAGLTARLGGYKVVIVDPADRLNRHAANALLKTLEEPPGATVFILVSSSHAQLLATIRSRCQLVDFPVADPGVALEWLRGKVPEPETALALAHGAPVRAVEMSHGGLLEVRKGLARDLDALISGRRDPVTVAAGWKELGRGTVSEWLVDILAERLRRSVLDGAGSGRRDAVPFLRLLAMLDRCLEVRGGVLARSGSNEQLTLERLASGLAQHTGSGS